MKCHKIGQADLKFRHCESHDGQACPIGEQSESTRLSSRSSGTFEDLPFRLSQTMILRKFPDSVTNFSTLYFSGIYFHARTMVLKLIEFRLVNIDGNNRCATGSGDLHSIAANAPNTDDNSIAGQSRPTNVAKY